MDTENKIELCGFGCGRKWDELGDENGFDDCVSAFHKNKKIFSWQEQLRQIVYEQELKPLIRSVFNNTLEEFVDKLLARQMEEVMACLPSIAFRKEQRYKKDFFDNLKSKGLI